MRYLESYFTAFAPISNTKGGVNSPEYRLKPDRSLDHPERACMYSGLLMPISVVGWHHGHADSSCPTCESTLFCHDRSNKVGTDFKCGFPMSIITMIQRELHQLPWIPSTL